MSNDEDQEYFADGVTEDIIGHLSLLKNLSGDFTKLEL